jgi:hypothetical protein
LGNGGFEAEVQTMKSVLMLDKVYQHNFDTSECVVDFVEYLEVVQ